MGKRFACAFLCFLLLFGVFQLPAALAETPVTPLSVAEGIISWKKADNGADADGYLLNDK